MQEPGQASYGLFFFPIPFYILTDVSHLFEDWSKVDSLFKFILIIQYSVFSIFGIVTFVVSVYFFQKLLKDKPAALTLIAICILNFLVGFAVILGGIERTNSWYILTNPSRVLEDVLGVIYSREMLMLSVGIGVLANIVYFLTLESILTWGKKYLKR